MPEIRPLRRSDRDQLTRLVNAHIDAVVPGVSVSPNAVLSRLERDPGEVIVDPWVTTRRTLVAVVRDAVVGVVHVLRYGDDERVGPALRGTGSIDWLLVQPGGQPGGNGVAEPTDVADALVGAALRELRDVPRIWGDGSLPCPGVYGVPEQWPHVAAALDRAGFTAGDRVEVVLAADVADLPRGGPAPTPDLTLAVALGGHAPRFSAVRDGQVVGMYEVSSDLTDGGTLSRFAGWAEGHELWVRPDLRRRGVATWLLGHAADRLRFARVDRLLDYAVAEPDGEDPGTREFLTARGFRELSRTRRGLVLDRPAAP